MQTNSIPETLLYFMNHFFSYLQYEKRVSPHTLSNYKQDLFQYASYLTKANVYDWPKTTESHVRQFLAKQRAQKNIARTVNRKISTLRSFYRYLFQQKEIAQNPMLKIASLKMPALLPKPLDADQISQLLSPPLSTTFFELRDHSIFELLYSTGLRLSELVALNKEDLDLTTQKITVLGKGNKMRIVFIGDLAKRALLNWLPIRERKVIKDEKALFISHFGKRISGRMIQKRLAKWGVTQKILTHVHPHQLRHSFASHLLESSGDLRGVQELLGHSNLNSTQVYTKINFQHLAELYDKCHPRANKKLSE